MSKAADEARARAEARFRQQYQQEAAEEAKADREAQAHAVEVQTERLKSLAADKHAGVSAPRARKKG